jgi:ectoine hydroxylase-related dioxygenase (phytanoyl-CoA dioxygenase family)
MKKEILMEQRVSHRAEARSDYERDGYVIYRNVLSPDLVEEASGHVDWLQEQHPDVRPEQLHHTLLTDDPFWVRLVSDPSLVDIAASFIGQDVALFASHYICKPPFSGEPVLWHQDAAYWPLEPMEVVTLWLAIDRSSPENGCVRVIPGSHRKEVFGLRSNDEVPSVFGTESAVEVDESEAVDMVLEPGDVEVHHPNILHSSRANLSPNRRCGLTVRYIPTSTRIVSDQQPYPSAFLLRGDPGVNQYQPRPRYVEGRHYAFRGADRWE